jgi:hypothetical protein
MGMGPLTGSGEAGGGFFGGSVALSSDGTTALIGGPHDSHGAGAVWVFTRSGSVWTQQGEKLTPNEPTEGFGASAALSADGTTALVGAERGSRAWIFTWSGSAWSQQAELGSGGAVALSSDGSTALVGGSVFVRSGSTWSAQAQLDAGSAVALSSDGNIALVGDGASNGASGSAAVFARSGTTWTQQGSPLTGVGEEGAGGFGASVALSAAGDTALIGGPNDGLVGEVGAAGAVWVFTRFGATWTQQGEKLFPGGQPGEFFVAGMGQSVGLSGDGDTALIGEPLKFEEVGDAAVYLAAATVSGVSPQEGPVTGGTPVTVTGKRLASATAVKFGAASAASFTVNSDTSITAVSPSATGTVDVTVVTPGGTSGTTAADQFTYLPVEPPPVVTKVSPAKGAAGGGTQVTITGMHLALTTGVKFGSVSAASFRVKSPTSVTAVSPAEGAKAVDVVVTTLNGTSAVSSADHFKFGPPTVANVSPSSGSRLGGTSVTITGTGFGLGPEATLFKFGKTNATTVECTTVTSCTVLAPSHAVGTVDVKATVNGQTSRKAATDQYTYM